ncbi:uracil phosphoribosyltransferase [Scardovia inopinata]|uniref:Uracil phosphoribosyltransferase n=2 Tax=Scardovia inopinata TaxID=78259 RepID=W5IHR1_SCAIO|nr:uracil phosphoribosyltransferase [Scardovia inopinata F0304]SUV51637.1 uracil phosphoribosyltransferase [Scardovia inopinata]
MLGGIIKVMTMHLTVLDHPLVDHKLTVLRDKGTPSNIFRDLISELVTLEAYEATRDLAVEDRPIETPVAPTVGKYLAGPKPMVVPILRAGLGMLDGMTRLLPTAEVGFLGMKRDENTLDIITYANRLPDDLTNRQCFLLDPMLATGGTLVAAIQYLKERGAKDITAIDILAAPEGLSRLEKEVDPAIDFKVVVCAVDDKLNDKAYIVPGLGDAGDRLYGLVD